MKWIISVLYLHAGTKLRSEMGPTRPLWSRMVLEALAAHFLRALDPFWSHYEHSEQFGMRFLVWKNNLYAKSLQKLVDHTMVHHQLSLITWGPIILVRAPAHPRLISTRLHLRSPCPSVFRMIGLILRAPSWNLSCVPKDQKNQNYLQSYSVSRLQRSLGVAVGEEIMVRSWWAKIFPEMVARKLQKKISAFGNKFSMWKRTQKC